VAVTVSLSVALSSDHNTINGLRAMNAPSSLSDPFRVLPCVLFIVGIFILAGCNQSDADVSSKSAATVVVVANPIEEPVVDAVDYTGRTDSPETVEIRARVTGFLNKVLFKDGEEVEKGQPLYEIDDREFQADLAAAKAQRDTAQARQTRADLDFKRAEALKVKGAITAAQYDQTLADKKEADAQVESAQAKVDRAQLDVGFSKIAAPISGKISRTNITAGNLVDANKTVLTSIVSVDPIDVYFDVDERTFLTLMQQVRQGKVEAGSKDRPISVYLGLTTDKGYPHKGTIDFLENRVNPATGTIRARGTFPNPKPAVGKRMLEAGLFARIQVPIGKPKEALLITERAIGSDQGRKYVYVVNDKNEVVFRPVDVGALHGGLRVVTEGLTAGERIIIDGLQRVRPGSIVAPKSGDMRSRPGESIAAATDGAQEAKPASTNGGTKQKSAH
jgi:RND family efflux transporter MFP subunit